MGNNQQTGDRRLGTGRKRSDPLIVRVALVGATLLIVGGLVALPLVAVFYRAFENGVAAYWNYLINDPDTRHSIFLTLVVAPVAVALNTIFGIAAAWGIARFRFPGRTILTTPIARALQRMMP